MSNPLLGLPGYEARPKEEPAVDEGAPVAEAVPAFEEPAAEPPANPLAGLPGYEPKLLGNELAAYLPGTLTARASESGAGRLGLGPHRRRINPLPMSADVATTMGPVEAQVALENAMRLGITPDVAYRERERTAQLLKKKMLPLDQIERSRSLRAFMSDPIQAAALQDHTNDLLEMKRTLEAPVSVGAEIVAGTERGLRQRRMAQLAPWHAFPEVFGQLTPENEAEWKSLKSGGARPAEAERDPNAGLTHQVLDASQLAAYEKLQDAAAQRPTEGEQAFSRELARYGADFAEMAAGSFLPALEGGAEGATIAGTGMLGLAAVLGPTPAGAVALAAAPAAAVAGGSTGALSAAFVGNFSESMARYEDLKREDGTTVSFDAARGAALFVASAKTGLDVLSFRSFVGLSPKLAAVLDGSAGGITERMAKALSDEKVAQQMALFGLKFARAVATEYGTESAQALIDIGGQQKLLGDTFGEMVEVLLSDAALSEAHESGAMAARATVVGGGLVGAARSMKYGVGRIVQARDDAKRVKEFQVVVERLKGVGEKSPAALAKVVQGLADDAGKGTLFVDPAAIPPKGLAALPPETQKLLLEAASRGEPAPIPTGEWAAYVAPHTKTAELPEGEGPKLDTETGEPLAPPPPLGSFSEDSMTPEEADTMEAEAPAELVARGQVLDAERDRELERVRVPEADAYAEQMRGALLASGRDPELAAAGAATLRRWVLQRARDEGRSVAEVLADSPRLSFIGQRGEMAPARPELLTAPVRDIAGEQHRAALIAAVQDLRNPAPEEPAQRYPVLAMLKRSGGVAINSRLGGELRNMGVTSRQMPGLMRGGQRGLAAADNLIASEHPLLRHRIATTPGTDYFDERALLEAIRLELAGQPIEAEDVLQARTEREQAREDLRAELERLGIDLANVTDEDAVAALLSAEQAAVDELFQPQVPPEVRRGEAVYIVSEPRSDDPPAADSSVQLDLFNYAAPETPTAFAEAGAREQANALVRIPGAGRVAVRRTGVLRTGITRVEEPQDVAHLIAPLRRDPQEQFWVVITDADHEVLRVVAVTRGTASASLVHPLESLGPVFDTPGAKNVWVAHNHPAGAIRPSTEDAQLLERMGRVLLSSGVTLRGAMIVAPSSPYATLIGLRGSPGYTTEENQRVLMSASARRRVVGIFSRRFVRLPKRDLNPAPRVEDVGVADGTYEAALRRYWRANVPTGQTGLLFLSTQHDALGFLPLSEDEMRVLRSGNLESGLARIVREAHGLNAYSFVSVLDFGPEGGIRQNARDAVQNLASFGVQIGLRQLDAFDKTSWTQYGSLPQPVLTFRQPPREPTRAELERMEAERRHFERGGAEETPSEARDLESQRAGLRTVLRGPVAPANRMEAERRQRFLEMAIPEWRAARSDQRELAAAARRRSDINTAEAHEQEATNLSSLIVSGEQELRALNERAGADTMAEEAARARERARERGALQNAIASNDAEIARLTDALLALPTQRGPDFEAMTFGSAEFSRRLWNYRAALFAENDRLRAQAADIAETVSTNGPWQTLADSVRALTTEMLRARIAAFEVSVTGLEHGLGQTLRRIDDAEARRASPSLPEADLAAARNEVRSMGARRDNLQARIARENTTLEYLRAELARREGPTARISAEAPAELADLLLREAANLQSAVPSLRLIEDRADVPVTAELDLSDLTRFTEALERIVFEADPEADREVTRFEVIYPFTRSFAPAYDDLASAVEREGQPTPDQLARLRAQESQATARRIAMVSPGQPFEYWLTLIPDEVLARILSLNDANGNFEWDPETYASRREWRDALRQSAEQMNEEGEFAEWLGFPPVERTRPVATSPAEASEPTLVESAAQRGVSPDQLSDLLETLEGMATDLGEPGEAADFRAMRTEAEQSAFPPDWRERDLAFDQQRTEARIRMHRALLQERERHSRVLTEQSVLAGTARAQARAADELDREAEVRMLSHRAGLAEDAMERAREDIARIDRQLAEYRMAGPVVTATELEAELALERQHRAARRREQIERDIGLANTRLDEIAEELAVWEQSPGPEHYRLALREERARLLAWVSLLVSRLDGPVDQYPSRPVPVPPEAPYDFESAQTPESTEARYRGVRVTQLGTGLTDLHPADVLAEINAIEADDPGADADRLEGLQLRYATAIENQAILAAQDAIDEARGDIASGLRNATRELHRQSRETGEQAAEYRQQAEEFEDDENARQAEEFQLVSRVMRDIADFIANELTVADFAQTQVQLPRSTRYRGERVLRGGPSGFISRHPNLELERVERARAEGSAEVAIERLMVRYRESVANQAQAMAQDYIDERRGDIEAGLSAARAQMDDAIERAEDELDAAAGVLAALDSVAGRVPERESARRNLQDYETLLRTLSDQRAELEAMRPEDFADPWPAGGRRYEHPGRRPPGRVSVRLSPVWAAQVGELIRLNDWTRILDDVPTLRLLHDDLLEIAPEDVDALRDYLAGDTGAEIEVDADEWIEVADALGIDPDELTHRQFFNYFVQPLRDQSPEPPYQPTPRRGGRILNQPERQPPPAPQRGTADVPTPEPYRSMTRDSILIEQLANDVLSGPSKIQSRLAEIVARVPSFRAHPSVRGFWLIDRTDLERWLVASDELGIAPTTDATLLFHPPRQQGLFPGEDELTPDEAAVLGYIVSNPGDTRGHLEAQLASVPERRERFLAVLPQVLADLARQGLIRPIPNEWSGDVGALVLYPTPKGTERAGRAPAEGRGPQLPLFTRPTPPAPEPHVLGQGALFSPAESAREPETDTVELATWLDARRTGVEGLAAPTLGKTRRPGITTEKARRMLAKLRERLPAGESAELLAPSIDYAALRHNDWVWVARGNTLQRVLVQGDLERPTVFQLAQPDGRFRLSVYWYSPRDREGHGPWTATYVDLDQVVARAAPDPSWPLAEHEAEVARERAYEDEVNADDLRREAEAEQLDLGAYRETPEAERPPTPAPAPSVSALLWVEGRMRELKRMVRNTANFEAHWARRPNRSGMRGGRPTMSRDEWRKWTWWDVSAEEIADTKRGDFRWMGPGQDAQNPERFGTLVLVVSGPTERARGNYTIQGARFDLATRRWRVNTYPLEEVGSERVARPDNWPVHEAERDSRPLPGEGETPRGTQGTLFHPRRPGAPPPPQFESEFLRWAQNRLITSRSAANAWLRSAVPSGDEIARARLLPVIADDRGRRLAGAPLPDEHWQTPADAFVGPDSPARAPWRELEARLLADRPELAPSAIWHGYVDASNPAGELLDGRTIREALGQPTRQPWREGRTPRIPRERTAQAEANALRRRLAALQGQEGREAELAEVEAALAQFEGGPARSGPRRPGPGEQGSLEPRGSIEFPDPYMSQAIVRFLTAPDRSTLFHELGHLYTMSLFHRASRDGAPSWLIRDAETLYRFVEATPGQVLTSAQADKLADAFWVYLGTGRAPARELRPVFARMRQWFVELAESVRDLIGLDALPDEIGQVFDRMLASDAEIAATRQDELGGSIFAPGDLSEQERLAIEEAMANDGAAVRGELDRLQLRELAKRTGIFEKVAKDRTRILAATEARIRDEVTAEVEASKVWRADHYLRTGQFLGRETPEDTPAYKISRAVILELFGAESEAGKAILAVPTGARSWLSVTKGVHPDELAEQLGYDTGAELVTALLAHGSKEASSRQRVIDEETKKRMRAAGKLAAGELEHAAKVAFRSEARMEFLRIEDAINSSRTGSPTMKGLAERADIIVAQKEHRHLRPDVHRSIARKSRRLALLAVRDGDFAKAQVHHRRGWLHELIEVKSRQRIDRDTIILNQARTLATSPKVRKEIGLAGHGYLAQIDSILELVELRVIPMVEAHRRAQEFFDWLAERELAGDEIVVPDWMRNRGQRPWRTLTGDEFAGLGGVLESLQNAARQQRVMQIGEELVNRDIVAKGIISEMRPLRKATRSARLTPHRFKVWDALRAVMKRDPTLLSDLFWSTFRRIDSWAVGKEPFIASVVGSDVTSWMFKALVQPFVDAANWKADFMDKVVVPIRAMADDYMRRHQKKYDELLVGENRLWNKWQKKPMELTRRDILGIGLNLGSRSQLEKLMGGFGWWDGTDEDFEPALGRVMAVVDDHMTDEDWHLVQRIWDLLEEQWPLIAAHEKKMTGVVPERVEPMSFVTRSGIRMRGGYFPVIYDPTRSERSAQLSAERNAKERPGGFGPVETRHPWTKARTGLKTRALKIEAWEVLLQHIEDVAHDLAYREPIVSTSKLLARSDIQEAWTEHFGAEFGVTQFWTPWLRAMGRDVTEPGMGEANRILRGMRSRATAFVLLGRPRTILVQPTGLLNGLQGVVELVKGHRVGVGVRHAIAAKYMADGIWQSMGRGNWKESQRIRAWAMTASGVLRHRMDTYDRDLRDLSRELAGKHGWDDRTLTFLRHAIAGMQLYTVDLPTWHAAYRLSKDQGLSEADAIATADSTVKASQGSGDLVANARYLTETSEVTKNLFTFLGTYLGAQLNQVRGSWRRHHSVPATAAAMAVAVWWPGILALGIGTLLNELYNELYPGIAPPPPEDEEAWRAKIGQTLASSVLDLIPVVREYDGAVLYGHEPGLPGTLRVWGDGVVDVSRGLRAGMARGEYGQLVLGLAELTGIAKGLPLGWPSEMTGRAVQQEVREGRETATTRARGGGTSSGRGD